MRPSLKAGVSTLTIGLMSAALWLTPQAAVAPKPGIDWPQFRGIKA